MMRAAKRDNHGSSTPRPRHTRGGFTLAEVLAALAFMAIVIPVAVSGLRVASLAGQVGQRKAIAARIGQKALNEWRVSNQGGAGLPRGTVYQDNSEYEWSLKSESWVEGTMRLVTVTVVYQVQGQDYDVQLSTLIDPNSL
ncbi:MAG: hypothetical protein IT581_12335 [Verrucomicrobiales bacterium]|nr:hypothetical protein [Verrucomicrobiales bacterium]